MVEVVPDSVQSNPNRPPVNPVLNQAPSQPYPQAPYPQAPYPQQQYPDNFQNPPSNAFDMNEFIKRVIPQNSPQVPMQPTNNDPNGMIPKRQAAGIMLESLNKRKMFLMISIAAVLIVLGIGAIFDIMIAGFIAILFVGYAGFEFTQNEKEINNLKKKYRIG